jgi:hypothetical protein
MSTSAGGSVIDVVKSLMNAAADTNESRAPFASVRASVDAFKIHSEQIKTKDIYAGEHYLHTHELPRKNREEMYTEYMQSKSDAYTQIRREQTDGARVEYVNIKVPDVLVSSDAQVSNQIYTRYM